MLLCSFLLERALFRTAIYVTFFVYVILNNLCRNHISAALIELCTCLLVVHNSLKYMMIGSINATPFRIRMGRSFFLPTYSSFDEFCQTPSICCMIVPILTITILCYI